MVRGGRFTLNSIFWTVITTAVALFIIVRIPGVRQIVGF